MTNVRILPNEEDAGDRCGWPGCPFRQTASSDHCFGHELAVDAIVELEEQSNRAGLEAPDDFRWLDEPFAFGRLVAAVDEPNGAA